MFKFILIFVTLTAFLFAVSYAGSSSESSSSSSSSSTSTCELRCGKNERSVRCPEILCVPLKCSQVGYPIACPMLGPRGCTKAPECVCIEGYVRNSKGKCIPIKNCPSCGGDENAVSGCGHYCEKHCDDDREIPENCPCGFNDCDCKKGYIYDSNQQKCVLPKQCTNKCKENEVWSSIGDYGCGKRNCTQIDEPDLCIDPAGPVEGGCVCAEGYLRARNGTCIPRERCYDDLCPKPHQYYDPCPSQCPARKCGIDDRLVLCAEQPKPGDPDCQPPACRCDAGYYMNDEGDCVLWEDCPDVLVCTKLHEYRDPCTVTCPARTCGIDDRLLDCMPEPKPGDSNCGQPSCRCENGYFRDDKGNCVLWEDCPDLCSKPHEYYDPCPASCPARTCGINDQAVRCAQPLQPGDPDCPRGACRCEDGYYRDDKGNCVRWENCPKCPRNEHYDPCPYLCPPRTCASLGRAYACPIISEQPCYPSCQCDEGLYRNNNGVCVTEEECKKCPANEIYNESPRNCSESCSDDGAEDQGICEAGCYCIAGYCRNDKGVCVPRNECPQPNGNQTTPTTPESCSVTETLALLKRAIAAFTGKFLYESYKSTPQSSLIMSPMSVFIPTGELALYSLGDTLSQVLNLLNLRTKDDIRCVFPHLTNLLRSQQEVILNMAARIFATDKYPLTQNFLDDTKNVFDAEAESIDFLNGEAAANRINAWVANETNDRIKDIATPDMFNEDTRLALVNAIYYQGNWDSQFNPNDTEIRQFNTSSSSSIQIPTMYQEGSFNYAEVPNLDSKILEMHYKGGNFSFVVILPNQVDGLGTLIEKLQDPDTFYAAYNSTTREKVRVYLPKIKTESEFNLSDILQKVGVTDIFDRTKSNLTDILQVYEPLYVSAARQKAFCEVDETGTEAAAANIIVGGATGSIDPPPPVYVFKANHVFVGAAITSVGITPRVYLFDANRPFAF